MKKLSIFFALLLAGITTISACDWCGCASSMGALSLGINNQGNFVSLRSQYAGFYAFDHQGRAAHDQYMQMDLFGQFALFNKLIIKADIPYGFRFRDYQDNNRQISGIGDPWLRVDYFPLSIRPDSSRKSAHELGIGLGVKAPLGTFQPETSPDGLSPLPANFQLGTGSWDNFFALTYLWQRNEWGLQLQANSRFNRPNKRLYQFGHQAAAQLMMFRWMKHKQHIFRLSGGCYAEHIQTDRQFSMGLPGTGGQGMYASLGVEYLRKNYSLNLQLNQPLTQQYAGGEVQARQRLGFSVSYFM